MLESVLSWWSVLYLALGLITGFLAGLLGIGGGLVFVAGLTFVFDHQAVAHAQVLPLALGTSMASIIFTAIASLRTHHAHGAVRWPLVRDIAPGVVLGALLGSQVVTWFSPTGLSLFFCAFMLLIAADMAFKLRPAAHAQLPGRVGRVIGGVVIGAISSLIAIGGGSLTVPWLSWCSVPIQQAIGTSAAMGLPIALAGSVGYIVNGWQQPGLPPGSIGYVYLPALVCLVAGSVITAPLGARWAHRLPVLVLKRAFAALLCILAVKLLWRVLA